MLLGIASGSLELRASADRSRRLVGRFPYNRPAVMSDGGRGGGRPRKEVFSSNAFAHRIEDEAEDIHLLLGHSYDQPLASRAAGTLKLKDTAASLLFEAVITPEMQEVSWVRDALIALAAGLIVGISPGFRVPPPRAVEDAESIEEEEDEDPSLGIAIIRTIKQALLYELSLVTRPAYTEAKVEERGLLLIDRPAVPILASNMNRWRP